jgi:Tol biopolymer transport system component
MVFLLPIQPPMINPHLMNFMRYRMGLLSLFLALSAGTALSGVSGISHDDFDWKLMKTIHFDVYYAEGMEETALEAGRMAEEGYSAISDCLRHELTEVVPVMLYPQSVAFRKNSITPLAIDERSGGFAGGPRSRIEAPFSGSYAGLRRLLIHELVHAFQFNILFNDTSGYAVSRFDYDLIPLWFTEGMADYLSMGFDETADMFMRDALFNEKYITLMDLSGSGRSRSFQLRVEGQAFFFFLERRYGRGVMGEIFRDLRDRPGTGHYDAFRGATGHDLEELNAEWMLFFRKRYSDPAAVKNPEDRSAWRMDFQEKTLQAPEAFPALSPDGRRVASLVHHETHADLVIKPVDEKRDPDCKTVKIAVEGGLSSGCEGLRFMNSAISWSGDSRMILFAARRGGRDALYLADAFTGKILETISPPMNSIRDPFLSRDGRFVLFSGANGGFSDIYLYERETRTLRRLTDDVYSDRHPVISPDNGTVIFSSNRNAKKDPYRRNHDVYAMTLGSRQTRALTDGAGDSLSADISSDGSRILYISDRSGVYNIYSCPLTGGQSRRLTDAQAGAFQPSWSSDGKKVSYVAYQSLGCDIMIRNLEGSKDYADKVAAETGYQEPDSRPAYFHMGNSVFADYSPWLYGDSICFGLAGSDRSGMAGFTRVSFSDKAGDHRLVVTGNYIGHEDRKDINFDSAYYYLKNRVDFAVGAFRQTSPLFIHSMTGINDLIRDVNFGSVPMLHYGGYAMASYPFSRFFRADIRGTVARYEHDYRDSDGRPDIRATLNQMTFSLSYDNLLWAGMAPAGGGRAQVAFRRSFDLSGQDCSFSGLDIDLRRYFSLSDRFIFAFRGAYGRIFGPGADTFNYRMGGYGTLRGHHFLDYSGSNMFFFNSEFRFTAIERLRLDWPFPLSIGKIGGALFADMGSAWDGSYEYRDKETGRWEDLRTDAGFGFRAVICPFIILKLDFAWPFDGKDFGSMDAIFSLGFEY